MPLETYQISSTPPLDGADALPAPTAPTAPTANAGVIDAIARHHGALADELRTRTAAVIDGARSGSYPAPVADLVAWFTTELLPHAHAEEIALYSAGSRLEATRLLVDGMVAEHRALESLVIDLTNASDPFTVVAAAAAAQALFAVHLAKENDLLLPALDAAAIDLEAALTGMHEMLGGLSHPAELDVRSLPHGGRHEIVFARLNDLPVGETFVILNDHDPKPLRYQTESLWPGRFTWGYLEAGPLLWRVAITREETTKPAPERIVDVRTEIPRIRHELIFTTFADLVPGTAFVLVNDHDPKPLYYQLAAENAGEFTWDYLEEGPEVWQVRIGRLAPA